MAQPPLATLPAIHPTFCRRPAQPHPHTSSPVQGNPRLDLGTSERSPLLPAARAFSVTPSAAPPTGLSAA